MSVFYGTQNEYSKFAAVQQKQLAKTTFKSESDQLRKAQSDAKNLASLIQVMNSSPDGNYGVGSPTYVRLDPKADLTGMSFEQNPSFMTAEDIRRYKESPALAGKENVHLSYNTPDPIKNMLNAQLYRETLKKSSMISAESPEKKARFIEIQQFHDKYRLEGDINDELFYEKNKESLKSIPKKELEYMRALKEQDKAFYNEATSLFFKEKQLSNQASDEFLRRIGRPPISNRNEILTQDEIIAKARDIRSSAQLPTENGLGFDLPKLVEGLQWMEQKHASLKKQNIKQEKGLLGVFKESFAKWVGLDLAEDADRTMGLIGLNQDVFRPNIQDEFDEATVIKVLDGDTFVVKDKNGNTDIIRALGVDTYEYIDSDNPQKLERLGIQAQRNNISEDKARSLGESAFLRAREFLEGKTVRLHKSDVWDEEDIYKRKLREIVVEGQRYTDYMQGTDWDANLYAKDLSKKEVSWLEKYGEGITDGFRNFMLLALDATDLDFMPSTNALEREIESTKNLIRALKDKPVDPNVGLTVVDQEAFKEYENPSLTPAVNAFVEGLIVNGPQLGYNALMATGAAVSGTVIGIPVGAALFALGAGLSLFDPFKANMNWKGDRRANAKWIMENTGLSYFNREDFDIVNYAYQFYKPYTRAELDTIEDPEIREAYERQLEIKDKIGKLPVATRVGEHAGSLIPELFTIFRGAGAMKSAAYVHALSMNKAKKLGLDLDGQKSIGLMQYGAALLAPTVPKEKKVWKMVDALRSTPIKGYKSFDSFLEDKMKKSKLLTFFANSTQAGLEGMTVWFVQEALKYNPHLSGSELMAAMWSGAFFHGIESVIGQALGSATKHYLKGKTGLENKAALEKIASLKGADKNQLLKDMAQQREAVETGLAAIGYTIGGMLAQPIQGIGAKLPFIDPNTDDWSEFWQAAGHYLNTPGDQVSFAGIEFPGGSEELFTDILTGALYSVALPMRKNWKNYTDYKTKVDEQTEIMKNATDAYTREAEKVARQQEAAQKAEVDNAQKAQATQEKAQESSIADQVEAVDPNAKPEQPDDIDNYLLRASQFRASTKRRFHDFKSNLKLDTLEGKKDAIGHALGLFNEWGRNTNSFQPMADRLSSLRRLFAKMEPEDLNETHLVQVEALRNEINQHVAQYKKDVKDGKAPPVDIGPLFRTEERSEAETALDRALIEGIAKAMATQQKINPNMVKIVNNLSEEDGPARAAAFYEGLILIAAPEVHSYSQVRHDVAKDLFHEKVHLVRWLASEADPKFKQMWERDVVQNLVEKVKDSAEGSEKLKEIYDDIAARIKRAYPDMDPKEVDALAWDKTAEEAFAEVREESMAMAMAADELAELSPLQKVFEPFVAAVRNLLGMSPSGTTFNKYVLKEYRAYADALNELEVAKYVDEYDATGDYLTSSEDEILNKAMAQEFFKDFSTSYEQLVEKSEMPHTLMNTDVGAAIMAKKVFNVASTSDLVNKMGSETPASAEAKLKAYLEGYPSLKAKWTDEQIQKVSEDMYKTFHPSLFRDNEYLLVKINHSTERIHMDIEARAANNERVGSVLVGDKVFEVSKAQESKVRKTSPAYAKGNEHMAQQYGETPLKGGYLHNAASWGSTQAPLNVAATAAIFEATTYGDAPATVKDLSGNGYGIFDISGKRALLGEKSIKVVRQIGPDKKIRVHLALVEGSSPPNFDSMTVGMDYAKDSYKDSRVYYSVEAEKLSHEVLRMSDNRLMDLFFDAGYHPSLGTDKSLSLYSVDGLKSASVPPHIKALLDDPARYNTLNATPQGQALVKSLLEEIRKMEIEAFYAFMTTDYAQQKYLQGSGIEGFIYEKGTPNPFLSAVKTSSGNSVWIIDINGLRKLSREPVAEMDNPFGGRSSKGYVTSEFQKAYPDKVEAVEYAIERAYKDFTEHQRLSETVPIGKVVETLLAPSERNMEALNDTLAKLPVQALSGYLTGEKAFLPASVQKALVSYYKSTFQNLVDLQLRRSINRGGTEFLSYFKDKKGAYKTTKYTEKYSTFITTDERLALSSKFLNPILERRGFLKNGMLTVRGVEIGADGEYFTRGYTLDPDSWKAYANTLEGPEKEAYLRFADYISELRVDAGSFYITNPEAPREEELMELMATIAGRQSDGSIKTRLLSSLNGGTESFGDVQLSGPTGSLVIKHALHPFPLKERNDKDLTPLGILNSLAHTLRDNGIQTIVFPSALKQEGLAVAGKLRIDKKEYEVNTKGQMLREVKKPSENKVPKEPEKNPFIPGGLVIDKSNLGKAEYDPMFVGQLKAMSVKIPLSGDLAMTWDEQKLKPSRLSSGIPSEMLSFGPYSEYMEPGADPWFKLYEEAAKAANVAPLLNAYEALGANKYRHGKLGNHLLRGRQWMAQYLENLASGKYLQNKAIADDPAKMLDLYYTLGTIRQNLMDKAAVSQGRYEDLELETHGNMGDYFKEGLHEDALLALNKILGISDESRFANSMTKAVKALQSKEGFAAGEVSKPSGSQIKALAKQMNLEYLPQFLMFADNIMYNPAFEYGDSPNEQKTTFFSILKQAVYNGAHARNEGSIAVLRPDMDAKGDLERAIKWGLETGRIDKEAMKEFGKAGELLDPDLGVYKDGSYGVTVSQDIMDVHPHWKIGEKVFMVLTPPDNAMSFVPLVITGIAPPEAKNSVTFASDLAIRYLGRDHDIDTMSIMGIDGGSRTSGYGDAPGSMWAREGEGSDMGKMNYEYLWRTLKSNKIREGEPKDKLVKAKESVPKIMIDAPSDDGKSMSVPFEDFSNLGPEFAELRNNYSKRVNEVPGPMALGSGFKRRNKFSRKQIDIAAATGKLAADWYNSLPNRSGVITVKADKSIGGVLSATNEKFVVSFRIDPEDMKRYNYHHSWLKEAAVDSFQQHSYHMKPYEWIANYLVKDINVGGKTYDYFHLLGESEHERAIKNAIKYGIANQMSEYSSKTSTSKLTGKAMHDELSIAEFDSVRRAMSSTQSGRSSAEYTMSNLVEEYFIDKPFATDPMFKQAMISAYSKGVEVSYQTDAEAPRNPFAGGRTLNEIFLNSLFQMANTNHNLTGHRDFAENIQKMREQVAQGLNIGTEQLRGLSLASFMAIRKNFGAIGDREPFGQYAAHAMRRGILMSRVFNPQIAYSPSSHYTNMSVSNEINPANRGPKYDLWQAISASLSIAKAVSENFRAVNQQRDYVPDLFKISAAYDGYMWGNDGLGLIPDVTQGTKDSAIAHSYFMPNMADVVYRSMIETYLNTPGRVDSSSSAIEAVDENGEYIFNASNPYEVPMGTSFTKKNLADAGLKDSPAYRYLKDADGGHVLPFLRKGSKPTFFKSRLLLYKKDGVTNVMFKMTGGGKVVGIPLSEFLSETSPNGLMQLSYKAFDNMLREGEGRATSHPQPFTYGDYNATLQVDGKDVKVYAHRLEDQDGPLKDAETFYRYNYAKVTEGLLFGNNLHRIEKTLPNSGTFMTPSNIIGHAPVSKEGAMQFAANTIIKTVDRMLDTAFYGTSKKDDFLRRDLMLALAEVENIASGAYDPASAFQRYDQLLKAWVLADNKGQFVRREDIIADIRKKVLPVIYGQILTSSIGHHATVRNHETIGEAASADDASAQSFLQKSGAYAYLPNQSAMEVFEQAIADASFKTTDLKDIVAETEHLFFGLEDVKPELEAFKRDLANQNIPNDKLTLAAFMTWGIKKLYAEKASRFSDAASQYSRKKNYKVSPSYLQTREGSSFYSELKKNGIDPLVQSVSDQGKVELADLGETVNKIANENLGQLPTRTASGSAKLPLFRTRDRSYQGIGLRRAQDIIYKVAEGVYKGVARINGTQQSRAMLDDYKGFLIGRGIAPEEAERMSSSFIHLERVKHVAQSQEYAKVAQLKALKRMIGTKDFNDQDRLKTRKFFDQILGEGAFEAQFPYTPTDKNVSDAIETAVTAIKSQNPELDAVEMLKSFISEKIAEEATRNPGDKKIVAKDVRDQDLDIDQMLQYQAKQKLAMFADRTEYLMAEIDKAQPNLAKIMMNSIAENIYEMYNVYKQYDKVRKRAKKAAMLAGEKGDISDSFVAEQFLFELDPTMKNNPMALADVFSNQQFILPSDQVLTKNRTLSMNDDGSLTLKEEPYYFSMLDSSSPIPLEGQKMLASMFAGDNVVGQDEIISASMPKPVLTSPSKIIMTLAQNLVAMNRVGQKDMEPALQEFLVAMASESEGSFESASISKAFAILSNEIMTGSALGSIFVENLDNNGKSVMSPRFRIKYFKTKSGLVKPYIEFKAADGTIHKGMFGQEGSEGWTEFVGSLESYILSHAQKDPALAKSLAALEDNVSLKKALSGFSALKLYNAHRGLQSFRQASRLDSLNEVYQGLTDTSAYETFPQIKALRDNLVRDFTDSTLVSLLDKDRQIESEGYNRADAGGIEGYQTAYSDYIYKLGKMPNQVSSSTQRVVAQANIVKFLKSLRDKAGIESLDRSENSYFLNLLNFYNSKNSKKLKPTAKDFKRNVKIMATSYERMLSKSVEKASVLQEDKYVDIWEPLNPELAMAKLDIAGESMPSVGGQNRGVYQEVSPASIARASERLDTAFLNGATTLLESLYRRDIVTKGQVFSRFTASAGQRIPREENFLVINETLGLLATVKGENYAFGSHKTRAQHSAEEVAQFMESFQPGERIEVSYRDGDTPVLRKGLFVGKHYNNYIFANIDDKTFHSVQADEVHTVSKGLSLPQLDRKINQTMQELFAQAITDDMLKEIDAAVEGTRFAEDDNVDAAQRVLTKSYYKLMKGAKDKAASETPFMLKQMDGASSSLAKMQYLGVSSLALTGIGTAGAIVTGLGSLMGIVAAGVPGGFLALAGASAFRYLSKYATNIARNYTSASREVVAMTGFFDTVKIALDSWKTKSSDTEAARRTSYMTFAQDEVQIARSIGNIDREPVQMMYEALQRANQFTLPEELAAKVEAIRTRLLDPEASIDFNGVEAVALEVLASVKKGLKSDGTIPEDILAELERMSYSPELEQFVLDNGQDIASLTKLRRQIHVEAMENYMTMGQMLPKSEEHSRKEGEKWLIDLLIRHSMQDHLSPQQLLSAVENVMNISVGEYGGTSRTMQARGAVGRVMGLYGRFARYNAAHYLSNIAAEIEKQDFVKALQQANPKDFAVKKEGYDTIKEYVVSSTKERSFATKGYNFDAGKAVGRKIAFASALGVTTTMASGGIAALLFYLGLGNLAEALGLFEDKEDGFVKEAEAYLGFGGIFASIISGTINLSMLALLNEEKYVSQMKPADYKKYWENAMNAPTEFMFQGGLGSGYASGLGAITGIGLNFMLYQLRGNSAAAKVGKIDDIQKEIWGSFINSAAQASGYGALPYQYGRIGLEAGYAATNPDKPKQTKDIIATIL